MPYDGNTYTGEELVKAAKMGAPFGPGFSDVDILSAVEMRTVHSSFEDPGEDWTKFVLVDSNGSIIKSRTLGGY